MKVSQDSHHKMFTAQNVSVSKRQSTERYHKTRCVTKRAVNQTYAHKMILGYKTYSHEMYNWKKSQKKLF
jgi:hypothetical protein